MTMVEISLFNLLILRSDELIAKCLGGWTHNGFTMGRNDVKKDIDFHGKVRPVAIRPSSNS